MRPKLISLGFAVPGRPYTQDEVFALLGYPGPLRRLLKGSGVETRHFWVEPTRVKALTFQQQQEEYRRGVVVLSMKAMEECLDGRSTASIGLLAFSSCTGFLPGPTAGHYLVREMAFAPSCYITNISAMGCEGAFPGLKRAADFTVATGKTAVVVACELSSCAYFPEPDGHPDPANNYELARSNAIFADAAMCALVGYDDDPRHPRLIDEETYTNTAYLDDLGFTWRDGRLRVLLSKKVPALAPLVVKPAVTTLLGRTGLEMKDIAWWIVHAAGGVVLDNIRDALGIPEEILTISREMLRRYGNTSSTSVGIQGKMLMQKHQPKPGDYCLMLSVGPGMTGGATLLHWE